MQQQEVERIARAALKELGLARPQLTILPVDGQPGTWRIDIKGNTQGPDTLKIRCGAGSTPQWVREQIVAQYTQ